MNWKKDKDFYLAVASILCGLWILPEIIGPASFHTRRFIGTPDWPLKRAILTICILSVTAILILYRLGVGLNWIFHIFHFLWRLIRGTATVVKLGVWIVASLMDVLKGFITGIIERNQDADTTQNGDSDNCGLVGSEDGGETHNKPYND